MDLFQNILTTSNTSENDSLDSSSLGPRRSIVRRIGSQLPLGSAERPTFELLPNGSHRVRTGFKKMAMFSLADIMKLDQMQESNDISIKACASAPNLLESISEIPAVSSVSNVSSVTSSASQDKMVTKISALEDELAQLRSQIALLVTNQQQQTSNVSGFDVSISGGMDPPYSTSTPIKPMNPVVPPPPPPPGVPPPPPPPPPPSTPGPAQMSVQDIIRQRKASKSGNPDVAIKTQRSKSQSSVPSMTEVLKDLHKVKLKSVSRSPGGTPFNNKKNNADTIASDPASLIAAALKKKFAHRKNFDSLGDGDASSSFDLNHVTPKKEAVDSPEQTPKFGQHLLKKRNTVPGPLVKPKPETPDLLKKRCNLENVDPAS